MFRICAHSQIKCIFFYAGRFCDGFRELKFGESMQKELMICFLLRATFIWWHEEQTALQTLYKMNVFINNKYLVHVAKFSAVIQNIGFRSIVSSWVECMHLSLS